MCVCVGVYGYSRWEKSIVARDVKKRCACLVRAHAFSQPRGNGRAARWWVWVGGGALVVVRGCGARAAAGLLRPGKGREDDRLPACSSSSSSSSAFSPARRASVEDLIIGISITTAIDLWYRIVSLRVG